LKSHPDRPCQRFPVSTDKKEHNNHEKLHNSSATSTDTDQDADPPSAIASELEPLIGAGVCKFYQEHDMVDFVPYLCAMDVPMSEVGKQGLHRTKTLAEGGDKCDFRFKGGRETKVNSAIWKDEFNQ